MASKDHERIARFRAAEAYRRILGASCKDLAIHEIDKIRLIWHVVVELPLDVAVIKVPGADEAIRSRGNENALVSVDPDIEGEMANWTCVSRKDTVQGSVWSKSSRHAVITYCRQELQDQRCVVFGGEITHLFPVMFPRGSS